MKSPDNHNAFTLIENIVVMMLLAIMVIGVFNLYPIMLGFVVREEERLIAYNLAYSQIEHLRQIASAGGFATNTILAATGGYVDGTLPGVTIPANFILKYYVQDFNLEELPPTPPTFPNYKRIAARCRRASSLPWFTLIGEVIP